MAGRSSQTRVWVLPNRMTPALAAVLVAMWYAGASQGNGAAYLLCFVLLALALVSIAHTWSNLRDLTLRADRIPPAFATEEQSIAVVIGTQRQRRHYGLELLTPHEKHTVSLATLEPGVAQHVLLSRKARHRGCFHELEVRVRSSYPLGFFNAQQRFILRETFWIYPTPRGSAPLPHRLAPTRQPRAGAIVEGDDYGGVRAWRVGESQRHIDWKAAARGQPLLTKQWMGEADDILCFDWHLLGALDTEARLSQLAKWVVLAERGTATYELSLPGQVIAASRGDTHYHTCLRALAVFDGASSETSA